MAIQLFERCEEELFSSLVLIFAMEPIEQVGEVGVKFSERLGLLDFQQEEVLLVLEVMAKVHIQVLAFVHVAEA